ncbi:NAD(P)/FAD-dependent oxidoreductase [Lysinibacillus sp. NPDC096418]|uniref:NAD(P)/FAD-dependent oxidoreductase n=1 Tax=Lysinibacillus sp. NPDC096418 TaxID=3364138 RepID=UPI003800D853
MRQKVIVIGGGIIGTSVTYYLSKKDIEVLLFEAKDIAAGTSGSCDKAIMLQSKKTGPNLDLALASAKMFENLESELGEDLEYHKGGGMILIENELENKLIQEMVERQNQAGLDVSIITGEQARNRIPALSKKIIAATWWEEDAEINPMGITFAFAKAAQRQNATIKLNCEVQSLLIERDRIVGIKTDEGEFYADSVVVCAGVWTKKLLETINITVPIFPRKGVILVTERLPPIINCNVLSGSYIAAKLQKENQNPFRIALAIGQTKSGTMLIGGSREFAGFDSSTSSQVIREIAKKAVTVFPFLKNVNLIRTFSGFRPFTPDNLPIISEVPSIAGVFIAAGHEGDGIALAPITGKIMSDMVSGQTIDIDLQAFKIDRFSNFNV